MTSPLGRRLIAATRLARMERRVEKAIWAALARREHAVRAGALTAAMTSDLFGEDEWDTDLAEEVEPVVAELLAELAAQTVKQFPVDTARVLGAIDVHSQVEAFMTKVRGISPEFARRINDELASGVNLGESIPELAARVESVFGMARNRATLISRTEVSKAANLNIYETARVVNQELAVNKVWLSAGDDGRTRDDHLDADGQTVAFDDDFAVGGEVAAYPGDERLSADQVCNCRCTVYLEAADESDPDAQAELDAAQEEADSASNA